MKRPTEKRVKVLLKDIASNFSELIEAIVWYEAKDMDDWSYDIIGYIESLPSKQEIQYLCDDLKNRDEISLINPMYKKLWYALFNVNQSAENTHDEFIFQLKNHTNKDLILNYINRLDEGEDSDCEINLRKILRKYNRDVKVKP